MGHVTAIGEYRVIKKIGSGAYGLVYLVEKNRRQFAMKVVSKLSNNRNYKDNGKPSVGIEAKLNALDRIVDVHDLNLEAVAAHGDKLHYLRELSIHLKVHRHENVVTIHHVMNYQDFIFVVMDYYPAGDLFTTIVDKKVFAANPDLIKKIFVQLLDVVSFCHKNKVYHCDIKPENVLITEDLQHVAITDFGLAVCGTEFVSDLCCGSSYYMAPERLARDSQARCFPTCAGDVWSLGIILINLACIRNPWMKACVKDETFAIYLSKPSILLKILPISKELAFILTSYMLTSNPFMRTSPNLDLVRKLIANCKHFTELPPQSPKKRRGSIRNAPPSKRVSPSSSSSSLSSLESTSSTKTFASTPELSPIQVKETLKPVRGLEHFEFTFDVQVYQGLFKP